MGAELDFAVNVAGTRPPEWLERALCDAVPTLAAYPTRVQVAEVEQRLARHLGVEADWVMLLHGAAEGFAMLPRLSASRPAIIHPGFSEPEIMLIDAHHTPTQLIQRPAYVDLPDAGDADLVVLGNPQNPTGVVYTHEQLAALRAPGRILVVDEAFLDIAGPEHTLIGQGWEDAIVLRSLTKSFAIAGLRVGFAVAPPALLQRLSVGRMHWPIGTLQLAAVEVVIARGEEHLAFLRAQTQAHRAAMVAALQEVGFEICSESLAPYVLVRPPFADAESVRRELRASGIAIRRCDTFPGLGPEYWRLAVRGPEEVAALLRAIGSKA